MNHLSQQHRLVSAVLHTVNDPSIIIDKALKLVSTNHAADDLFHLSPDKSSYTLQELWNEDEITDEFGQPCSIAALIEGAFHGAPPDECIVRFRSSTMPESRWLRVRIVPVQEPAGAVEFVVATFDDLTDSRATEQALRQQTESVETINRIGQLLSAQLDLQTLVQTITDAATELAGAQFGAFFYNVINEQGEAYTLYTLSGVPREAFMNFPMPRNTHVFGPTFRGEGVVRSDDITKDPRYGRNKPYRGMPKGHLPVCSYLAVSVVSRSGEVLGGLFFGHPEPRKFGEREEQLVVGLAAQGAIAMDNARLYSEVKSERQRLKITLSSIGDAVIATDNWGKITFMNEVAEKLTGWRQQDALHKPIEEVVQIQDEATRAPVESPVRKVLREGTVANLPGGTILIAKDGREIPIDDSGAPIRNDRDVIEGVVLVFRDVTERRQTQRELAESEQRYRLLFEKSTDAILVANEAGRYIAANHQAEILTGYSRDELLNMHIWELTAPSTPELVRTAYEAFRQTGTMSGQYRLRRKDSTILEIEASATYVSPGRYQSVIRDITQRNQIERERAELLERERIARQKAEEANDLKLRFLAMISHELRTPLASIKGFSSTLLASDVAWSDNEQQQFITVIDDEANKLSNLVEQLIDVSRLQAGSFSFVAVPQSLTLFMTHTLPELQFVAGNHRVELNLPNDLPLIPFDRQRISQVLINLVQNAAKYAPETTVIIISAVPQDSEVKLSVADEGIGIPLEHRQLVFEAFRQLSEDGAANRGAGLGLAICKGIVEAHGGGIWIEDNVPQGTVMSFTLPVASTTSEAVPDAAIKDGT